VLEAARLGIYRLQLSQPILDETVRILQEKFAWPEDRALRAAALISGFSHLVVPHLQLDVVTRHPADNRILECSQASNSDYLITSDKDLLDLRIYAGTAIIKPVEYLAIFKQRAR
jgi:putative PIN family toxin of toxin-antitoxin system